MHLATVKPHPRPASFGHALFLAVACATFPVAAQVPEHPAGAAIYRKLFAECHGAKGRGVKEKYDDPLHGDRTGKALARRIARTMPDDNVGACVGEDAAQ